MKRCIRPALLVLGLIGLGVLAGIGHAQRFASKEPIPGSKIRGEIPVDADLTRGPAGG